MLLSPNKLHLHKIVWFWSCWWPHFHLSNLHRLFSLPLPLYNNPTPLIVCLSSFSYLAIWHSHHLPLSHHPLHSISNFSTPSRKTNGLLRGQQAGEKTCFKLQCPSLSLPSLSSNLLSFFFSYMLNSPRNHHLVHHVHDFLPFFSVFLFLLKKYWTTCILWAYKDCCYSSLRNIFSIFS